MSKLSNLAKATVGGSPVMENRVKGDFTALMSDCPDNITITAVDMLNGNTEPFCVFTCVESPLHYYFGGKALTDIVTDWLTALGSIEAINNELAQEPLKIKAEKTKTKAGRDFTRITVID